VQIYQPNASVLFILTRQGDGRSVVCLLLKTGGGADEYLTELLLLFLRKWWKVER
jgi:hypothetical protein